MVLSCGGYMADKIISVFKRKEGGRESGRVRERGREVAFLLLSVIV